MTGGVKYPVCPSKPVELDPPKYESTVLPKGHQKRLHKSLALPCDILYEKDVAIKLRDGVTIYVDIFRANADVLQEKKLPSIISWSPYGKSQYAWRSLNGFMGRLGVPDDAVSDLQKWEGVDPAYWCPRGYTIVHPDPRGAFNSEGVIRFFGTGEGQDGYDVVEWIAEQSWSNGRVAMAGNSWLAASQWFIAAERPPHLTCIAPWEGLSDLYIDHYFKGGRPSLAFAKWHSSSMCSHNGHEDMLKVVHEHPLYDEMWKEKAAKLDLIECPAYILASYSSKLHTTGSIRGFREIPHDKKWLRLHPTFEWYDLYSEFALQDLQKFFDHYLLDVDNDWEKTPPVRHCLLSLDGDAAYGYLSSNAYPPPSITFQHFYLDNFTKTLSPNVPIKDPLEASYNATEWESYLHYDLKFSKQTTIVGFSKVILYVATSLGEDMDIWVQWIKLDAKGHETAQSNTPFSALSKVLGRTVTQDEMEKTNIMQYQGPSGELRVSHRGLDEGKSTMAEPFHPHQVEEKITPKEIYKIEIGLWPSGVVYKAGESLRLRISGREWLYPEMSVLYQGDPSTVNQGKYSVWTGGIHASELILPIDHDMKYVNGSS